MLYVMRCNALRRTWFTRPGEIRWDFVACTGLLLDGNEESLRALLIPP